MKKLLFSLILILGFLSFGVANAIMTFDPASPQICEIASITPTCSKPENILTIYTPDNSFWNWQTCENTIQCSPDYQIGVNTIFECDISIENNTCQEDESIASSTEDLGFISSTIYTFTVDPYSVLSDSVVSGTSNVYSSLTSNVWRIVGLGVLVILIFLIWRVFRRFTR